MTKSILAILATLSLFAAGAAAKDQLIFLKGGRVFRGEVLKSDWDTFTLKVKHDNGTEEIADVPAEYFVRYFYYTVREQARRDEPKGRMHLTKLCIENDMFSRAKIQLDRAEAADAAVVADFMKNEFPAIKEGLADKLLSHAKRSLRQGSTKSAKKWASLILTKFEGTAAEPEAEKLLSEVQAKIDEKKAAKRAQRRRSQKAKAEIDAREVARKRDATLGPIEKLMDDAAKANERGLRARNMSEVKTGFETAGKKYESAIKRAENGLKSATDETVTTALSEMKADATNGAVQAYLNMAHSLSARGSYNQAVKWTNRALALDPNNAEAKAARMEISTTAAGWGRGGSR